MPEYFTRASTSYKAPSDVIVTVAAPHDRVVSATITDIYGEITRTIISNGSKIALREGEVISGSLLADSAAAAAAIAQIDPEAIAEVTWSAIGAEDGNSVALIKLPSNALGPNPLLEFLVQEYISPVDADGDLNLKPIPSNFGTELEVTQYINDNNAFSNNVILSISSDEFLDTIKEIVVTRNFQYALSISGGLFRRALAEPFLPNDLAEDSYYDYQASRIPEPDEYTVATDNWEPVGIEGIITIARMPKWNGEYAPAVSNPALPPSNFDVESSDGIIFARNGSIGVFDGYTGLAFKPYKFFAEADPNGVQPKQGYSYPRLPILLDENGNADYAHYTQGGTTETNGLNPSELSQVNGGNPMIGRQQEFTNIVKIAAKYNTRGVEEEVHLIFDDGSYASLIGFMGLDLDRNPEVFYLTVTVSNQAPLPASLSHLFLSSTDLPFIPLTPKQLGKNHLPKIIGYFDQQSANEIFHNNSNLAIFLNQGFVLPEGTAPTTPPSLVLFRYWTGDTGWAETNYKGRSLSDVRSLIGISPDKYVYATDPTSDLVNAFSVPVEINGAFLATFNIVFVYPITFGWMPSNGHPVILLSGRINNLFSMAWVFGIGEESQIVDGKFEVESVDLLGDGNYTLIDYITLYTKDGRFYKFDTAQEWFQDMF